jgi:hypothetical protein
MKNKVIGHDQNAKNVKAAGSDSRLLRRFIRSLTRLVESFHLD